MQITSDYELFSTLTFTLFPSDKEITGQITAVIAAEVGHNSYGIFYFVETPEGVIYEVEECTLSGSLKEAA